MSRNTVLLKLLKLWFDTLITRALKLRLSRISPNKKHNIGYKIFVFVEKKECCDFPEQKHFLLSKLKEMFQSDSYA